MLGMFSCNSSSNLDIDSNSKVKSTEIVFKSERGFGSDTFEIHKFTLVNPNKINGFKNYDDNFKTSLKFFSDSIDESLKKYDSDRLYSNIDKVINAGDSIYKSLDYGDEIKLYIYSPKLNDGYFIYLKI